MNTPDAMYAKPTNRRTANNADRMPSADCNAEPNEPTTAATPASVRTKFDAARAALSASLVERDAEIELALTAVVAGEHLLLVGPPGTAKSALCDGLMSVMGGGNGFSYLLTKFTTPEELFGPISINGLKNDQYKRVTTGRLPEADVAFVDEVFKSSSAILNTLLKILNERTFSNGEGKAMPVPLRVCVGASNEWPVGDGQQELGALFDRFVLRKTVRAVSPTARENLLFSTRPTVTMSDPITTADMDFARQSAVAIPFSDAARKAFLGIIRDLAQEGIIPGDRRQVKAVGIARAAAWLEGSAEVQPDHLEVLAHVLWDDPRGQQDKCAQIVSRVSNPAGFEINKLLGEFGQIIQALDVSDLVSVSKALKQIEEIERKMRAISTTKAAQHAAMMTTELKKIKRAFTDSGL